MFLHTLNPAMKACTVVGLVFVLACLFDPVTPLVFTLFTITVTLVFGRFRKRVYALYLSAFTLFAFGMLWTTIAFADTPSQPEETIPLAGFLFPKEDVLTALALSFRVMAFAALSLLFVFTTNMVHFILSLIQQLKLPPKLAYGLMAGYRFLPMMKEEFDQIRAAHRIRGVTEANSIKGRFKQLKRYAIPLLAGAVRKAERTAAAMESKGFTGERTRTYYRPMKITGRDWVFPLVMFAVLGVLIVLSFQLDYFRWYNGQF
ncbi:energy-coupling factor transporter transmembrane component T family protein [Halobacillus litoralis]|uniref:energy-coupling factor transporter transmembrane component T family protein n=1 Tax=Halobacillus litoralis TaxID=45668 RepID=UPI00136AF4F5|nr:energy-coupling factor transporter transmembrane component T [Halobacillus litoralis]MYL37890.1 energy-coupling factor transporter transmembrane protein EcfT [Halobacillus litoralis]